MITQDDISTTSETNTVWKLSREDKLLQCCEGREDYYRNQLDLLNQLDEVTSFLEQRVSILAEKAKKEAALAEQASIIAALKAELEKKSL